VLPSEVLRAAAARRNSGSFAATCANSPSVQCSADATPRPCAVCRGRKHHVVSKVFAGSRLGHDSTIADTHLADSPLPHSSSPPKGVKYLKDYL